MSLALRFGGLSILPVYGGVILVVLPRMPRLPTLADLLPRVEVEQIEQDSRLEQLRRRLEENENPPFMIDNGTILKAAPKKRPSHRRTREKLYAPGGKQIQPLQNLGRCPACGHVKRSHFMCMHCFAEIRTFLKAKKKAIFGEPEVPQANLDPVDERIIYPGKFITGEQLQLKQKKWVPVREEPLPYEPSHVKKK